VELRAAGSSRRSSPAAPRRPIMTAEEVDVRADFDACAEAHTMLGSGGVIVRTIRWTW